MARMARVVAAGVSRALLSLCYVRDMEATKNSSASRWYIRLIHLLYPELIHVPLPTSYTFNIGKANRAVINLIQHHVGLLHIETLNRLLVDGEPPRPHTYKPITSTEPTDGENLFLFGVQPVPDGFDVSSRENLNDLFRSTPDVYLAKNRADTIHHSLFANIYYTEIQLFYKGHVTNKGNDKDRYLSILNHFLSLYRKVANDPKIRLANDKFDPMIIKFGRADISEGDYQKDIEEIMRHGREFAYEDLQIKWTYEFKRRPGRDPSATDTDLRFYFSHGRTLSLAEDLLERARHMMCNTKNYRSSFLDAFSSAEIIVDEFLRTYRRSRGIADKNLEKMEGEVGFAYKITIDLPTILSPLSAEYQKIINDLNSVRSIRNKMVHEGRDVSESEAKMAIDTTALLHKMLMPEKFTPSPSCGNSDPDPA